MDCYSIPHMEGLFSELAGATHYSQTDLSYHQLPLHPESHKLTAFITHEGLFQFTCSILLDISPINLPEDDVYSPEGSIWSTELLG